MPRYLTALTKTRLRVVVVISICFGLLTLASVIFPSRSRARVNPQEPAPGKRQRARFVPGEVLVRYKTESVAKSRQGASRVTTREGLGIPIQVERFTASDLIEGLRLARVPPNQTLAAVAALKRQPDVLDAEPNYLFQGAVIPNDPRWNDLLSMSQIDAPTAWNTNTGSKSIVVAVVDQGIDINHEDLAANIWTNPAPGSIPGITNDLHGYNFLNGNGNVFSGSAVEDHASHVAGIIGAVGNNGKGVVGVNWAVSLMSLKFLDTDNFGEAKHALSACTYAKQMRDLWQSSGGTQGANIRVVNASFGGGPYSHLFEDAVSQLNNSGILFVAAAGNFSPTNVHPTTLVPNNDLVPQYPSNFNGPNVVAVAATTGPDDLASFSHFGALTVDLGAPGQGILSTVPGAIPYKKFDGTSMAAPHVSGAAALLWAQNPNLTVQQVKNLLLLNGDVSSALTGRTLTGRRLNVGRSFQSLAEGDTTPPGTVTGFNISSQTNRTLNLSWTATGDDGGTGLAKLYLLDYVDGSSGAVLTLKSIIPADAGTPQSTTVNIPFGHPNGTLRLRAFDNAGNEGTPATLAVNIPLAVGDPYVPSVGSQASLSTGGDRQNLDDDDVYREFLFPTGFSFPFFGETFHTVTISSNGALYFSAPPLRKNELADDVPSAPLALNPHKMIAGLWDDLNLRNDVRTDSGVYVVRPDSERLIFRWQGVPCAVDFEIFECTGTDATPVNFEIELRTDGTIKTRYGSGNTALNPTVGISGGDRDGYVIRDCKSPGTPAPCYTSESLDLKINLTNAAEVTFTPRAGGATPTPTPTPSPSPSPSPSPTPTLPPLRLVLEEGGPSATQAAALDSMLFIRDLFPVINSSNLLNTSPDKNTRVIVFVENLFLLPGETSSNVEVQLSDGSGNSHNIGASDVRILATPGFAQVTFRLPDNLTPGTWTIRVAAHSLVSNTGTIRIRAP